MFGKLKIFVEMTLYDKVLWEWIKKPWLKYWKMQTLPWRVNLLKRFDKHWDWVHWWVVAALLWNSPHNMEKKLEKFKRASNKCCGIKVLKSEIITVWNGKKNFKGIFFFAIKTKQRPCQKTFFCLFFIVYFTILLEIQQHRYFS